MTPQTLYFLQYKVFAFVAEVLFSELNFCTIVYILKENLNTITRM